MIKLTLWKLLNVTFIYHIYEANNFLTEFNVLFT